MVPHSWIKECLDLFRVAENIKDALSGQREFSATESPLKMMKNAFYFTSKALSVLKIFKFFVLTFWSCIKTA